MHLVLRCSVLGHKGLNLVVRGTVHDNTFKCDNKEWEEAATNNSEQHNKETLKGQKMIFATLTKSSSIL